MRRRLPDVDQPDHFHVYVSYTERDYRARCVRTWREAQFAADAMGTQERIPCDVSEEWISGCYTTIVQRERGSYDKCQPGA